jgi:hypothetical protein
MDSHTFTLYHREKAQTRLGILTYHNTKLSLMSQLVKVKCAFCRKEFLRRKGQFNEAKKFGWKQYCSWRRLSKDKLKRQILFYENCGKRFERTSSGISPHNYCSWSCAAIVNNKKYPKRHPEPKFKTCKECGRKYRKDTNNKKYCSIECRRKNAVLSTGFQPNRSHENRMYKRIITKAKDGHPCDSFSEAIIDDWLNKNNIPMNETPLI